jgi:2-hydroxychromene-2-carboxylate isomerase
VKPTESDRPLICYLDIKSPYAYLALEPTRRLAQSQGIAVDWRPLTLDIPSFAGSARLGPKGEVAQSQRSASQWAWVKYAYKDARRYFALRGYALRGTEKIWDTDLIGLAFMHAKGQGDDVLDRFLDVTYRRFWDRRLDVENPAVVESLLGEVGAPPVRFSKEDLEAYQKFQLDVFDAGIFGVPGYIVDGEYYWGREHLPRIEWILRGRRGSAPDVAYEA